jgi:hypothetical protein
MSGNTVPDIILERYRLGELPPGEMAALRARAATEGGLRARLDALERSDSAILESLPAAAMAQAIDSRAGRERAAKRAGALAAGRGTLAAKAGSAPARPIPARPWFRRPVFAAPAGLALACSLLLILRMPPDPGNLAVTEDPEAYAVRLKGSDAGLAIFRKSRGAAELLPPHSLARSGDTLQVFYHSRGTAYGLVFSVDGSGSLTLHLPETGSTASALQAGDLLPLPHAYRLDRAPGLERFFLITASEPFPIGALLDRARASFAVHHAVPDSLEGLEAGFRQYPYTLRKPGRGGRTR